MENLWPEDAVPPEDWPVDTDEITPEGIAAAAALAEQERRSAAMVEGQRWWGR